MPPKVCVARGRLHLRVTEQFPDHRQTLPEGERPRGEAVAQVMQANVFEPGLLANDLPRRVQCAQTGTAHAAGKHPGAAGPRLAAQTEKRRDELEGNAPRRR